MGRRLARRMEDVFHNRLARIYGGGGRERDLDGKKRNKIFKKKIRRKTEDLV